jgi:hypothetical protein
MFATAWLAYFEGNARCDRLATSSLGSEVPRALWAPLALSLGRFQLGEAAGGRIHAEMSEPNAGRLSAPARRSVQLYIEEEWRHSRELASIVLELGGELQRAHWTNSAFTACRRLLGLRTKMMTLAVAEVIGIVYYRALARGVGSPMLADSLERIADEEARHLDFQAAYFEHVLDATPRLLRPLRRGLLFALLLAIFGAALAVLLLDHGALLRRVGGRSRALQRDAWAQLAERRFLLAAHSKRAAQMPSGFDQTSMTSPEGPFSENTMPGSWSES